MHTGRNTEFGSKQERTKVPPWMRRKADQWYWMPHRCTGYFPRHSGPWYKLLQKELQHSCTIPTPIYSKLIVHLIDLTAENDLQKHLFCYERLNKEMYSTILFSMVTCHNRTIQSDNGPEFPLLHTHQNLKAIEQTKNWKSKKVEKKQGIKHLRHR
jgi:hypothetical protein